jgi:hypothetical protein
MEHLTIGEQEVQEHLKNLWASSRARKNKEVRKSRASEHASILSKELNFPPSAPRSRERDSRLKLIVSRYKDGAI